MNESEAGGDLALMKSMLIMLFHTKKYEASVYICIYFCIIIFSLIKNENNNRNRQLCSGSWIEDNFGWFLCKISILKHTLTLE